MNKEVANTESHDLISTIRNTPGWVWVLIGGLVLLVIGLLAAKTALPTGKDFG